MNIDEAIQLAFKYHQEGNLQQAENIYKEILKAQPSNFHTLHYLGILYYEQGNYDFAIEYIDKALQLIPTDAHAYYNLGNVYKDKGQLDEAIRCFQEAIKLNPTNADAHFAIGNAFRKKGLLNHAIMSYQKAIQFRPDFADGYCTLGNIYEEMMMFDEAASCYLEVVRINPNHSYAYAKLGFAFYNRGRLDEAIRYLEMFLKVNPKYEEAYCCLGMIFTEKAKFDEAILCFNKALEINPESAWLYTNLGATMQQKGQHEEGRKYLHKALEKNPNIYNAQHNLDNLLIHDHEFLNKKNEFTKTEHKKILITVSTFNRKKITALSLEQTKRYKTTYCHLQVYNDHSSEYDNTFLSSYADKVILLPNKMGINDLRWYQFENFLETDFDFLYMTDNDVIHDPNYVSMLEQLYEKGKRKLPVSLFNSIFMLQPRLILFYEKGVFIKTSAQGLSMFYDKRMVEKIVSTSNNIGDLLDYLPWDAKASACLELPWITPEISYLEHFGADGLHSDNYERQRAINPTEYLQERRSSILQYLTQDIDLNIDF